MKKKFLWILLFIPFIEGCLEDKGNYNYNELNKIEFEDISYNYQLYYGDSLKITPKLKFALDSVNINLEYEWAWMDSTIAQTPELHIKNFEYYSGKTSTFFFRVKDLKSNMIYVTKFLVEAKGTYQNGWLILAEKDQKSSLSIIKINKTKNEEGKVEKTYSLETDIYQKVNEGELGNGPIKLHEHFNGDLSPCKGEVLVAQKSGSVELNGPRLEKVVTTEQEFIGEKYPSNFQFKDAVYTHGAGYLLSTNGKLYYRVNQNYKAFQSGRFFTMPKKDIETGKDFNCSHILRTQIFDSRTVLLFDQVNPTQGRIIFLSDQPYSPEKCGQQYLSPILDPQASNVPGFSPLDNIQKDLIYWTWKENENWTTDIIALLRDRSTNNYYIYKFAYEYNVWDDALYYKPKFDQIFVGNDKVNEKSIFKAARRCPYLFFSGGSNNNELYYCEIDKSTTIYRQSNIPFNAPIVSMDISLDGTVLGIGLTNGEFYLIETGDITREGILFHATTDKNIGKIIDCIYKIGSAYNDAFNSED